MYVASGALGMLLPLLGAMRNAAIIRHRAPPLWLLPLLGAMRNHPVIIFDNVGELLLPLLGAMRNPIARELAGDDAATLLPLLGAMRNPGTTGSCSTGRGVATPLRGDEERADHRGGDQVGELLLPLLGAMRNRRPRVAAGCTATCCYPS